ACRRTPGMLRNRDIGSGKRGRATYIFFVTAMRKILSRPRRRSQDRLPEFAGVLLLLIVATEHWWECLATSPISLRRSEVRDSEVSSTARSPRHRAIDSDPAPPPPGRDHRCLHILGTAR